LAKSPLALLAMVTLGVWFEPLRDGYESVCGLVLSWKSQEANPRLRLLAGRE
jgi:hypothetical protein